MPSSLAIIQRPRSVCLIQAESDVGVSSNPRMTLHVTHPSLLFYLFSWASPEMPSSLPIIQRPRWCIFFADTPSVCCLKGKPTGKHKASGGSDSNKRRTRKEVQALIKTNHGRAARHSLDFGTLGPSSKSPPSKNGREPISYIYSGFVLVEY